MQKLKRCCARPNACSRRETVAYQIEEYKKSALVVIFHCFNSFHPNNYVTFSLSYELLRENQKINAGCFPSFHNGCNPACQLWRRLRTGEWLLLRIFSLVTQIYLHVSITIEILIKIIIKFGSSIQCLLQLSEKVIDDIISEFNTLRTGAKKIVLKNFA